MTQGAYFEVITANFIVVVNVHNLEANISMIYVSIFRNVKGRVYRIRHRGTCVSFS